MQLWLARHEHQSALIIRRSFPQLERTFIPRALERFKDPTCYNGSKHTWSFRDGCRIEFGYLDSQKDVYQYQGAEFDGLFVDELTQIPRDWYLYLVSRLRSTRPGHRCRIVATSNPGGEFESWVVERWAPWLDDTHPRPAASGEVRWFKRLPTEQYAEIETDASDPEATSRTFVRMQLSDNPYLAGSDYEKNLSLLPEPYRSQLRDGRWKIGDNDDAWQVIPTEWVRLAQERWREEDQPEGPPDVVGVDVARGGKDRTVFSPRWGSWYGRQATFPGDKTPDGPAVVARISMLRPQPATTTVLNIDVIGVGSSVYDGARERYRAVALQSAEATNARDKSRTLGFMNKRAEWWWKFREALDPASGEDVALPPDPELKADLTSVKWRPCQKGVQIEPKEDIIARIDRSPDKGDSCVYASAKPREPRIR